MSVVMVSSVDCWASISGRHMTTFLGLLDVVRGAQKEGILNGLLAVVVIIFLGWGLLCEGETKKGKLNTLPVTIYKVCVVAKFLQEVINKNRDILYRAVVEKKSMKCNYEK